MNKILIGLLLLGSFSTLAGTLENRANGDFIQFDFNLEERTVKITSSSANTENETINLSTLRKEKDSVNLYGMTEAMCELIISDAMAISIGGGQPVDKVGPCFYFPVVNIPGIVTGAVNTILLPLFGTAELLRNMKYNKDFNKLNKAIKTNETIRVSNKRFERIEKLLSGAY